VSRLINWIVALGLVFLAILALGRLGACLQTRGGRPRVSTSEIECRLSLFQGDCQDYPQSLAEGRFRAFLGNVIIEPVPGQAGFYAARLAEMTAEKWVDYFWYEYRGPDTAPVLLHADRDPSSGKCYHFSPIPSLRESTEGGDVFDAARKGDVKMLKAAIENGVDVDSRTPDGWTPLMFAAGRGHLDACRFLLDQGASVSTVSDRSGIRLLDCNPKFRDFRPREEREQAVAVNLGEDAAPPVANEGTAELREIYRLLCAAAAKEAERTVELFQAIEQDDTSRVETILKRKCDLRTRNDSGLTPLMLATSRGNVEVCRLLLRYKASPLVDNSGMTVADQVRRAVYPMGEQRGRELLDLLEGALVADEVARIREIELTGWRPDRENKNGRTPLMEAAFGGNVVGVRSLLVCGADARARNKDGLTAYDYAQRSKAVEADRERILEVLREAGATGGAPGVK